MALMDVGSQPVYRSRGYQLEMLEASQKENIIVAVCFAARAWGEGY